MITLFCSTDQDNGKNDNDQKGFFLLLDTGCQSCQQQLRQISTCPEPCSDFDCQHQSSDSKANSNGVGVKVLMAIPNHITGSLMAHDSKVELNPMATQQRTYITRKVVASTQVTCIIKRDDIADQVRDPTLSINEIIPIVDNYQPPYQKWPR